MRAPKRDSVETARTTRCQDDLRPSEERTTMSDKKARLLLEQAQAHRELSSNLAHDA